MKLTKTISVEDIEKISILYDSYHDAIIKIVYEIARDLQFLGNSYEQYREKVKPYEDTISNAGFIILWNLAVGYNKKNFPCRMETLADIQEKELAERDLENDFILLHIDDD